MKDGAYPRQEAVWAVNPRYNRAQGALFAQTLAMLAGAVDCSPKENDYEFKNSIIFEDDADVGKGNLVLKLLKGLLTGGLSFRAIKNLAGAAGLGGKMNKHYLAFPQNSVGFEAWKAQADKLWVQAGNMAAIAEADLKTMG
jgi:hypothetical protein